MVISVEVGKSGISVGTGVTETLTHFVPGVLDESYLGPSGRRRSFGFLFMFNRLLRSALQALGGGTTSIWDLG